MDAVLDGVAITHVEDIHRVALLADALDAAFALFETCGVPRQVEIDGSAETLLAMRDGMELKIRLS